MLFSLERRKPRITQSKTGLTLLIGQRYFHSKITLGTALFSQEKKSKAKNHPDKNCVNGIRVHAILRRDQGGLRLESRSQK